MSAYDDISPNPHRLIVKGWNETFGCHECVVEGSTQRVFVDLFVDGTLPAETTPADLFDQTVEVNYTHGFVWLASEPRIVEWEQAA